jgi:CubicO group peptidase (beta-lactamase class C family)
MTATETLQEQLQGDIEALAQRHGEPGMVAGILVDGEIVTAATGVTNVSTQVPMTPDTVFLTGSITKVWTTTLVMTMVDEGIITLDEPIASSVQGFRVADPEATAAITMRHLVTHASGIDAADFIEDFGENPDAIARYVAACRDFGQVFPPGAYTSYCNADFVIAGWVAEQITGQTYDDLLLDRVIRPLGLTHTGLGPHHAILHRVAVGHFPDGNGGRRRTDRWMLPRSCAPAGSTLVTTVSDSLRFAQMHLDGGVAAKSRRVLSEASARLMRERQLPLPIPPGRSAQRRGVGLGWRLSAHGELTAMSHTGGSYGGYANLFAVPERGIAGMSFVNSTANIEINGDLQRRVLERLLGPMESAGDDGSAGEIPADLSLYAGTYERQAVRTTVGAIGSELEVQAELGSAAKDVTGSRRAAVRLRPVNREIFQPVEAAAGVITSQTPHYFLDFDESGRPALYYWGGRLSRRVDGQYGTRNR